MNARYQPPASQATGMSGGLHNDDMPPQALTGRACCCPARAVVRIILPPSAGRPHETDLLLCGHHFRV